MYEHRTSGQNRQRTARPAVTLALCLFMGCSLVMPKQADEYVDGKLRLRYWQQWTGVEAAAIQKIVDRFNASQDKLYVDYMSIGQYDRKRLVAIAGGTPPDLAES